jgi:hypothetical protein
MGPFLKIKRVHSPCQRCEGAKTVADFVDLGFLIVNVYGICVTALRTDGTSGVHWTGLKVRLLKISEVHAA